MHVGLALPFYFDPERLKADLAQIRSEEWTPHYNQNDFGGDWRGVALRSPTGHITNLTAPFTAASTFADTALMTRCVYLREVAASFLCPLKAVRLLSLAPGSFIREHVDNALVYEDGEMRIHIPVQTSTDVEFYVAGERLNLEEGHSYYVNVNLPHRITNRGRSDRVHLIIDLEVNDWVDALVGEARARHSAIARIAPPPRGFDDFASLVLSDTKLRERLLGISDRWEFVEATVRLARERGFDLIQPDVEAALRVNVLNGVPVRRVPRFEPGHSKVGWTPIEVHWRNGSPFLEWIYTGERRFTEPFFTQTVQNCLYAPFTLAFRQESRLDHMDESELTAHSMAPSGFIFHTSRCGSTLVAQMLASLPSTVVLSEPPLLDQVLQAHLHRETLGFEEQVNWFRRLVLMLGQRRTGAETHFFIKLDAWHIHRLRLVRAAFPDTPCVFLFRDPVQVLRSHELSPGMQCLPGAMPDARVLGLATEDIIRLSRAEWCTRVIAKIYQAALASRHDVKMLFVDFSGLPQAVYSHVARHFSLHLEEPDLARMRERSRFEARTGLPWSTEEERAAEERTSTAPATASQDFDGSELTMLYAELQQVAEAQPLLGNSKVALEKGERLNG